MNKANNSASIILKNKWLQEHVPSVRQDRYQHRARPGTIAVQVGLSGIVDLTQAQLAQTEAEIGVANARFAYQTALAVVKYQTGQ